MKDLRLIERRAKELGILDDEDNELLEFLNNDNKDSLNNMELPDYINKNLINFGKKMGSYYDALLFFLENDIINDSELVLIKNSPFYNFLHDELEKKNLIKKGTKNKLW